MSLARCHGVRYSCGCQDSNKLSLSNRSGCWSKANLGGRLVNGSVYSLLAISSLG